VGAAPFRPSAENRVKRMSPKLRERMRKEWQAHLDALPGALSKLSAAAGFLFSTFWGFRRYREDETPIEIEERIAIEVAVVLHQERMRVWSAVEALRAKEELAYKELLEKHEKSRRTEENRTELVKRRIHGRFYGLPLTSGYKTTRHKGTPYRRRRDQVR
jgi:hypothetical protein